MKGTSLYRRARIRFDYEDETQSIQVVDVCPDRHRILKFEDSFQGVLRITRSFLHEILDVTLVASMLGERGQDGAFERLSASYDITDALVMSGGIVLYQKGDNVFFRNIDKNDRVFLDFKYSF